MIYLLLGLLSGVVVFIGDSFYTLDILHGKTKPHRVTWFVFVLLNVIDYFNQAAVGATNSLWLFVGGTLATLIIFILSIFRGVGGYSIRDIVLLSGALTGCFLWYILDSPLASIVTNIAVGVIALTPTFIKSYNSPESETKLTWLLVSLGGFLAAASISVHRPVLYILPLFGGFIEGALYVLIVVRLKQRKPQN